MNLNKNSSPTGRVQSLDLLRGIVMVLMVLDHARFLLHNGQGNPENLDTTTPVLFFTRWVTHFCAPVFIFLAGTAAFLFAEKNGLAQTIRFLWTRGLLLIVIEFTVIRLGWDTDFARPLLDLLVAWAIGISMLFLALALRFLPFRGLLALGAAIVLGHNLLDGIPANPATLGGKIWLLLHQSGFFFLTKKFAVFVLYPVLPYLGLITLGYCFGKLYAENFQVERRRQVLLLLGLGGITVFLLLRTFNLYGDPSHWSPQKDALFSALSFLKTTKYPTSLLYNLMTLGPALLLLRVMDGGVPKTFAPLCLIGQTPLFFYLWHLYLIKLVGLAGGGPNRLSLAGVYAATLAATFLLYWMCRFYRRYKLEHPEKQWLRYL
ncbi:MAG: heparan-alpha-glucosaminide N-acetyltransferase domain-containing protein [Thermoanaerobaculia bacterium]|nr:heparan-alpha-glucosaminide N-acetyltransferase domain-containing protein [Thermoanaerobaculia bacterium]